MAAKKSLSGPREYTVVLKGLESQLRIPDQSGILISPITSDHGPYELRITTRRDSLPNFKEPIPRELWVEVKGPAPSLESAVSFAGAVASEYLRQLAFCANAWQGLLRFHLAFDSSPGQPEREFVQDWVMDERGIPRPSRSIEPDLMFRCLAGLAQVQPKERSRINRAIVQYTDALQHWKPGEELYALAHIYMGVEALTPTVIRTEVRSRGFNHRKDLEKAVLRLPKQNLRRRLAAWLYRRSGGFLRPPDLETWARRELIFLGDSETFKTARDASDKLEHGLAHHDEVHLLATKCLKKSAEYLRSAILAQIPLNDVDRAAFQSDRYGQPANTNGLSRQLHATILCEDDEISAPDQAYPLMQWAMDLKDFEELEGGTSKITVTQQLTPKLGARAKVRLDQLYVGGAREIVQVQASTESPPAESKKTTGIELQVDDPENGKWIQLVGSFILNCNSVRYSSIYWVIKLIGKSPQDIARFEFRELVAEIRSYLNNSQIDQGLKDECLSAWSLALELDEARATISSCAPQPDGLVPVDAWDHGSTKVLEDVQTLRDLNDKIVETGKKLTEIFDRLIKAKR